jgi:hypothetical protein
MDSLLYITIIGKQHIGKTKLINNIISGKQLHPLISIFNKDNTYININKKFYKYNFKPWFLFKLYNNIKRTAYIVVNISIIDSVTSIPYWYNKIQINKMDNIFIILINQNKDSPSNLNLLHFVIQFCSIHQIKLINLN